MREELQELLEKVELEDILDWYGIDYKAANGHSGEQFNLRECPSCGTAKWKVYLNAETGLGNCFTGSCGATFNKFSFLKAYLGAERAGEVVDALREIARAMGWRPKRKTEFAVEQATNWELPASIELPTEDGQNLTYLEARGFDAEIARYFHLRYCHEGFWVFKKPDGTNGVQQFHRRLIVPVYDLDGEMQTFQGRDITNTSDRKYLFPSGLPGTGRFLLNGHNANGAKRVVMAEGFFDVAAVKVAVDAAPDLRDYVPVGSFGKHLSKSEGGNDQYGRFATLQGRGLEEVVIMWDGEPKALQDALNAGQELQRLGLRVRVALLPAGKDPNEVDAQVVQDAIRQAPDLTPKLVLTWRIKPPYKISQR